MPIFIGGMAQQRIKQKMEAIVLDIPRIFTITESEHRIHNPYTSSKLATLGAALRLKPEARVLDLGSGSGEMLCTWARDHAIVGTGIDMSPLFCRQAKLRAEELGLESLNIAMQANGKGMPSTDQSRAMRDNWMPEGVEPDHWNMEGFRNYFIGLIAGSLLELEDDELKKVCAGAFIVRFIDRPVVRGIPGVCRPRDDFFLCNSIKGTQDNPHDADERAGDTHDLAFS